MLSWHAALTCSDQEERLAHYTDKADRMKGTIAQNERALAKAASKSQKAVCTRMFSTLTDTGTGRQPASE